MWGYVGIMCISCVGVIVADETPNKYNFFQVNTRQYISFPERHPSEYDIIHNKTKTYNCNNFTEVSEISDSRDNNESRGMQCWRQYLSFENFTYELAGTWELKKNNRSIEYTIFGSNIVEEFQVIPKGNISVTINQNITVHMAKVKEKTIDCLLIHNKTNLYNITENKISFVKPRYDCGGTIEIHSWSQGEWQLVQKVEGGIVYHDNFFINVQDGIKNIRKEYIDIVEGDKYRFKLDHNVLNCALFDPRGNKRVSVSPDCSYAISSVCMKHAGKWTMHLQLNDDYNIDVIEFNVTVYERKVETSVIVGKNKEIHLLCYVKFKIEKQYCHFQHPNGTIFNIHKLFGHEEYEPYSNYSTLSSLRSEYCGITIRSSKSYDYGAWRCQIKSRKPTMTVGSLLLLNSTEVSQKEQQTEFKNSNVYAKLDNILELSCTINDFISKCWMKSPNGSVYMINESDKLSDFKYNGRGFLMGDCGMTIEKIAYEHDGEWTCIMELTNGQKVESNIHVRVAESSIMPMQDKIIYTGEPINMSCIVIPGETFDCDVCRWIKPDGNGIHYDSDNYHIEKEYRKCTLNVKDANVIGTWTCILESKIGTPAIYSANVLVYDERPTNVVLIVALSSIAIVFLISCVTFYICKNHYKANSNGTWLK